MGKFAKIIISIPLIFLLGLIMFFSVEHYQKNYYSSVITISNKKYNNNIEKYKLFGTEIAIESDGEIKIILNTPIKKTSKIKVSNIRGLEFYKNGYSISIGYANNFINSAKVEEYCGVKIYKSEKSLIFNVDEFGYSISLDKKANNIETAINYAKAIIDAKGVKV